MSVMSQSVNEEDSLLEVIVVVGELKIFELIFITYHLITVAAAMVPLRRLVWMFEDSRSPLKEKQCSLVFAEFMSQKLAKSTLHTNQLLDVQLFFNQIGTFLNYPSPLPLSSARKKTTKRPVN